MADQGNEGLLSPFLRNKRINAALPYLYGGVLDVGCGSGFLASYIPPNRYLGVDIDEESLSIARSKNPDHRFQSELPSIKKKFDTICALAVIEHIKECEQFLLCLTDRLSDNSKGSIILTSPHPITENIHYLGAKIGIFSRSGNEEHERLLNKSNFLELASECGCYLFKYRRFLLGMNQLIVYKRESCL